jgi:CheY-like chemotaxis protein
MPARSNAPHLLIVEGDADTREILGTILREEGYAVSLALSLQEATTLLEEHVFHFVLTDLFPTDPADPLRSVAALRAQVQPTPIGLLTGWKVSDEAAQRAGFACSIRKPFDLDELLATIASCLHMPLNAEQQRQAEDVQHFFAALNARDWDTAMGLCAAQLAYYPAPDSLYAPLRKLVGKERYRAYAEDVFRRWSVTCFEQVLTYARPKGLAARYIYGITLSDGSQHQRVGATLFHFRGGLITRIGVKMRRESALKLIEHRQAAAAAPLEQL